MEDTQRIVKCGNLALHTPGGFFKKRWHSKYLVLYDGSKSGVKRLELFESEIKFKKQSPVKIIPLVDCVRIVTCQRHKTTFTFEVRTSDQFYLLASKSFQDMNDWVNCLRFVAFGQQQPPGQTQQQQQLAAPVNPNSQLLAVAAVTQRHNLKQPPVATKAAGSSASSSSSLCATSSGSSSSGTSSSSSSPASSSALNSPAASSASLAAASAALQKRNKDTVDVLLQCQQKQQHQQPHQNKPVSALSNGGLATSGGGEPKSEPAATPIMTASQAAAAAASALAKTRQRQPSLLGSCKPQPPTDSPFIQQQQQQQQVAPQNAADATTTCGAGGQIDTLTPTVRGQLIATAASLANGQAHSTTPSSGLLNRPLAATVSKAPSYNNAHHLRHRAQVPQAAANLDEEEENMLYCSIEDNPSEHNYRVKVIETELALRCQLKCYQLTASTTVSQQYEELSQFRLSLSGGGGGGSSSGPHLAPAQMVTFYQLIIGPQELTLLNDYATSGGQPQRTKPPQQPQGLWSWPYQCIRRYGFDKDNCFMFEAGRKCTSGPGQFVVQTPKAYNIYQDVVKFVNELRTISGGWSSAMPTNNNSATTTTTTTTTTSQSADAAATATATAPLAHTTQSQVQPAASTAVTQIPVTWAPHCATTTAATAQSVVTIPSEPSDNSRRQFFDALRQLDANQTTLPQAQRDEMNHLVNESETKRPSDGQQLMPTTINTSQPEQVPLAKHSINSLNPWPHQPNGLVSTQTAIGSHDFPVASRKCATQMAAENVRGSSQQDASGQTPPPPPLPVRSESARALAVAQLESRLSAGNKLTSGVGAPQRPAGNTQVVASAAGQNGDSGAQQRQQQQQQQQLASLSSSNGSAEEETDESGYEQGDESVESGGRARTSPSGAKSTKSQVSGGGAGNSSDLSSASSSSSSSPGQSVSRRRTGLVDSGPALETTTAISKSNTRLPLPASLIKSAGANLRDKACGLAQQTLNKIENHQEDFEASLIRDVYSEITKLHAKFAVTTNGTDEGGSMSSGESHTTTGSSSSATCSDDNLEEATNEEEEEEDEDDYDSMESEPMYTNLSASVGAGGQRRRGRRRIGSPPGRASRAPPVANHSHQFRVGHTHTQQQKQQQQQQQLHHYDHSQLLYRTPHYPSMLNPIPEIAEQQQQVTGGSQSHRPVTRLESRGTPGSYTRNTRQAPASVNNNLSTGTKSSQPCRAGVNQQTRQTAATAPAAEIIIHNTSDIDKLKEAGSPRARLALNREAIKRSQQSAGPNTQIRGSRYSLCSSGAQSTTAGSKTSNHYLINDVQYAKISRNMTGGTSRAGYQQRRP